MRLWVFPPLQAQGTPQLADKGFFLPRFRPVWMTCEGDWGCVTWWFLRTRGLQNKHHLSVLQENVLRLD